MGQLEDWATFYFIWDVARFFTDTILNLYVLQMYVIMGPTAVAQVWV